MRFDFDASGRYEYPVLVLCNPDFTQLYMMEQTRDLTITPRFNAVSEIDFNIYQYYNDIKIPYYDSILKNKLVYVVGFGYWIIDTVTEHHDGGVPYKEVHCFSYEYTLNYKGINLLNGTYKFTDLLDKLVSILPQWKVGHIDTGLWNLYRTFDVPDGNLYGFLMNEVSNTYEVIFEFDTENLLINAYEPKKLVRNTDIMLTFDNLNKEISVEELSTDVYTVLAVSGADNVSIAEVNPLGDNRLYNFSYYNNPNWIEDENLRNKITQWDKDIEEQRVPYNSLLTTLSAQNRDLLKLKTELRDLQSELSALEIVRKNLVDEPDQQDYFRQTTDKINAKNVEIKDKNEAIASKQADIDVTKSGLKEINNKVRFDKYFTNEEQIKLEPFIIESVYQDDNFIITDQIRTPADADGDTLVITTNGTKKIKDLTNEDIVIDAQYIENQLLEQGKKVLETISQPSFTFSLDSANFLFIEKFKPFIEQIGLGSQISVEIKDDDWAYPVLLEMTINYDNPTDFSMTFGNRFRLSTAEWTYADLHNESIKTASQVGSTLGVAAEPVLNGTVNEMSEYMANSLIAANQEIQSTADNEVTFGGFGLRLRKKDPNYGTPENFPKYGGYDPHQTWLNNNLICMTDD